NKPRESDPNVAAQSSTVSGQQQQVDVDPPRQYSPVSIINPPSVLDQRQHQICNNTVTPSTPDATVEEAAIKIQALVRGHLARKALKGNTPLLGERQFDEKRLFDPPSAVFSPTSPFARTPTNEEQSTARFDRNNNQGHQFVTPLDLRAADSTLTATAAAARDDNELASSHDECESTEITIGSPNRSLSAQSSLDSPSPVLTASTTINDYVTDKRPDCFASVLHPPKEIVIGSHSTCTSTPATTTTMTATPRTYATPASTTTTDNKTTNGGDATPIDHQNNTVNDNNSNEIAANNSDDSAAAVEDAVIKIQSAFRGYRARKHSPYRGGSSPSTPTVAPASTTMGNISLPNSNNIVNGTDIGANQRDNLSFDWSNEAVEAQSKRLDNGHLSPDSPMPINDIDGNQTHQARSHHLERSLQQCSRESDTTATSTNAVSMDTSTSLTTCSNLEQVDNSIMSSGTHEHDFADEPADEFERQFQANQQQLISNPEDRSMLISSMNADNELTDNTIDDMTTTINDVDDNSVSVANDLGPQLVEANENELENENENESSRDDMFANDSEPTVVARDDSNNDICNKQNDSDNCNIDNDNDNSSNGDNDDGCNTGADEPMVVSESVEPDASEPSPRSVQATEQHRQHLESIGEEEEEQLERKAVLEEQHTIELESDDIEKRDPTGEKSQSPRPSMESQRAPILLLTPDNDEQQFNRNDNDNNDGANQSTGNNSSDSVDSQNKENVPQFDVSDAAGSSDDKDDSDDNNNNSNNNNKSSKTKGQSSTQTEAAGGQTPGANRKNRNKNKKKNKSKK
ncbi:hypothetical protein GZH46_00487, partial [Fragariocoptes setiger]